MAPDLRTGSANLAPTVEGPDAKVRGVEAQELGIPVDGSPADTVDHFNIGRILAGRDHRVILGTLSLVRAEAELGALHLPFVVQPARGKITGVTPAALLQTDDPHTFVGQCFC